MRFFTITLSIVLFLLLLAFTSSAQEDSPSSSDTLSSATETETIDFSQGKEESSTGWEDEPEKLWPAPVTDSPDTGINDTTHRDETKTASPSGDSVPLIEKPVTEEKSDVTIQERQAPVEKDKVPPQKVSSPSKDKALEEPWEEPREKSPDDRALQIGLGLNIGVRFHFPEEINNFVTDIWTYAIYDTPDKKIVEKSISPGLLLKAKGLINPVRLLSIEPFAQGMWAGKMFSFQGGMTKQVNINSFTLTGGLNLWLKILPEKMVSMRIGGGGFAAYTVLKVTGDIETTKLYGTGYGGNAALGIDITIQKTVINLDIIVPIGFSELGHKHGYLEMYPAVSDYPSEYVHTGFEICPGVTFYF